MLMRRSFYRTGRWQRMTAASSPCFIGRRDLVPACEAFRHKTMSPPPGGMDYFVLAITDGQHTVVVDAGFSEGGHAARPDPFSRSPRRAWPNSVLTPAR